MFGFVLFLVGLIIDPCFSFLFGLVCFLVWSTFVGGVVFDLLFWYFVKYDRSYSNKQIRESKYSQPLLNDSLVSLPTLAGKRTASPAGKRRTSPRPWRPKRLRVVCSVVRLGQCLVVVSGRLILGSFQMFCFRRKSTTGPAETPL